MIWEWLVTSFKNSLQESALLATAFRDQYKSWSLKVTFWLPNMS
ncbi:hypothetical protein LOK49_LG10G01385 [Camellia lanceoleosa]|uniref:Uncharacterized protein n=1 Tax=Camellia lanceoleosa TaxID=1840588 RepID=A0ACC0GD62_9ERIC|nr:hypothetical protein LOK49_LG10G01385 [Camellia lanceoleosa]